MSAEAFSPVLIDCKFNVTDIQKLCTSVTGHSISAIMEGGIQNLIYACCYWDETYLRSKVTLILTI